MALLLIDFPQASTTPHKLPQPSMKTTDVQKQTTGKYVLPFLNVYYASVGLIRIRLINDIYGWLMALIV